MVPPGPTMAVAGVGAPPSSIMVLGEKGAAWRPKVAEPVPEPPDPPPLLPLPLLLLVPMPLRPVPCSCGREPGSGDCMRKLA